ncbi:unnamed protein product [Urochloa decumbens]|uniref:Protein EARLY HEADING DATE 2 n=1 Tax=Urochloa decumbens TaxID=240449 RepID=A0ABC9FCL6_9POAL
MAAASSAPFFGLCDTQMQPQGSSSSSLPEQNSMAATAAAAPPKKKRNPPGNPNPDAEVVALSPRTLMATNRFVCEVCNKGFQREQNLQLHRRGHNLPWKLKQKDPNEARRWVYVCPEPRCVHHDPSRALGDLTGIKKHYCRKHGEKKLKCDKCDKRYAVHSDWKAHSKICGTREYRCDCGMLFSRRDSFVSHRTLCDDALARESAETPPMDMDPAGLHVGSGSMDLGLSSDAAAQMHAFADQGESSAAAAQFDHIMASAFLGGAAPSPAGQDFSEDGDEHSQGGQGSSLLHGKSPFHGLMQLPEHGSSSSNANDGNLLNLGFFSSNSSAAGGQDHARLAIQDQFDAEHGNMTASMGSHHSTGFSSSLFNSSPQISATALLMKAAQMGSTSSIHNGPSALLRAAGFCGAAASGGQGTTSRAAGEGTSHEAHFHDLIMNSLTGGGGGGFSMDDGKLSTRDFLGVGRGAMAPPGLHTGALDPAQMK